MFLSGEKISESIQDGHNTANESLRFIKSQFDNLDATAKAAFIEEFKVLLSRLISEKPKPKL